MTHKQIEKAFYKRAWFITAIVIFILGFVLLAVRSILQFGFDILNLTGSIGTALIVAAVSVLIGNLMKEWLSSKESIIEGKCKNLGIEDIDERDVGASINPQPPRDILNSCRNEILICAYSAEKFIENNAEWIANFVDKRNHVGIILLHPKHLEQAEQTDPGIDLNGQIKFVLSKYRELTRYKPERVQYFKVKGYCGHMYYTGIFADRAILKPDDDSEKGLVRIQLKGNYQSQRRGLLIAFAPQSKYAKYYEDSCRKIWEQAKEIENLGA